MAEKVDTWMPVHIGALMADTLHLNTELFGAYLLLLFHYWRKGAPPDDNAILGTITRLNGSFPAHRETLSEFFTIKDGRWWHKRVEEEIDKARGFQAGKSRAGKAGAEGKWGPSEESESPGATRAERLAAARRIATHTPEEWQALLGICDRRCLKCEADESARGGIVKDHITPIFMGGSDGIDNLQPLCHRCNSTKGPDTTDHRPTDWRERLADACQTPAPIPRPIPQPSPEPTPEPEGAPRAPSCPVEKIVALYHEKLPGNPKCVAINETRRRHIRARWDDWRKQGKYHDVRTGLDWWARLFAYIGESAFLTGRASPRPGRGPFVADIDFIFGAEKNVQIVEGKYHDGVAA